MITAETVNGIVRFQANGLPVVSLYCRVDPGASQREVRARVDSLLDQIRPRSPSSPAPAVRGLYAEIPLPRPVRGQVMVDATPLTRPMLAVPGEYRRACVLVINREAARSGRCTRTR